MPRQPAIATMILAGFLVASLAVSCRPAGSERLGSITVGVPPLEQNALLYVAESRGFFGSNGLDVSIKDYDTGVATVNALLAGEVDVAELAEFPFIKPALEKRPLRILAVNDRFENDYLLVRKDRGIAKPADLEGKEIGVIRGTILEFYLGRFLRLNGIGPDAVTIVDTVNPSQTCSAIVSGTLDAVVAFQPHVNAIQSRLGDGLLTWRVQSDQLVYGILVSNADWLSGNSLMAERFLKSLAQAEDYITSHPKQARDIVQHRLNLAEEYIAATWPLHQFNLSLDFSLIVAMNDEARWMIDNKLTAEKTIPDFKDLIYLEGLRAVKPEAVNIVR